MKKFLPSLILLFLCLTSARNMQSQVPVVQTYYPEQDAAGIDLDVILSLEFDTNIKFNSTGIVKYIKVVKSNAPGDEILNQYIFGGESHNAGISINSATLLIDLGSLSLSPETEYSVIIDEGALENATDNTAFEGIDDINTTWRFTTVSRPAINFLSPADEATGITGLQTITLTFDETVNITGDKNLEIYKNDGTLFQVINTTTDAAQIAGDGTTSIAITHNVFNGSQVFYINADEGFVTSQTTGVGSASIDGSTQWSFTTASGPDIASIAPASTPEGIVHADAPLVIGYSKPVTLADDKDVIIYYSDATAFQTINTTTDAELFSYNSSNYTLTIDHNLFPGNSAFDVFLEEGLVIADDNNIASEKEDNATLAWSFATTSPPLMSFDSPLDDAVDIAANEYLIIGFNEAVSLQYNKNITIYNSDNTTFQIINTDANSDLFSFNATNDQLTISHDAFAGNSNYYINIDKDLVRSDNTVIGSSELTDVASWSFTTANGPSISSFTPDGAANVPGNQSLQITFSENVSLGADKNLYIYRSSDDQLFQTINTDTDAGLFTVTDATIQISHDPLWGNTGFYILTDEGLAVSSTTEIGAEGINSSSQWTFTTTSGPTADTYSPAVSATGVSVTSAFEINFNENIALNGSGSVVIRLKNDDSAIETINYDSNQLSVSNNTLTITHTSLSALTDYYISIDNGLVLSASSGTPWTGINDQSWSFTTGGAPSITGYSPSNGDSSAPINQILTLTFDENIQRGSAGYIKIRTGDGQFFQDIPYDAGLLTIDNSVLQISHDEFDSEATYYIIIDNGVVASATTDVPFSGYSDVNQWRFTTPAPPVIDSFTPSNGSTLTSASQAITLSFNENIELGTSGSFRIFYSGGDPFQTVSIENTEYINITDNTLTITHQDFSPDSSYYILINQGFVKSGTSGVSFPGIRETTTWAFTSPSGPQISAYYPENNAIDIATDEDLTLTFDESIARGTGNMVIHYQSDGSDAVTISASSANLTIDGNTLTFPNLSMPHEETLYVTMDSGFVKSASTVFSFAGISDPAGWVFTTLPEPPAWSNGYPNFDNISPDNINLALMTSHEANYYFVVTSNSIAPSITQIMSGQNSGGSTAYASGNGALEASTEYIHSNINISGLSEGYHWLHVVAKNPTKELYSAVTTLQIDKVPPVTTISPSDGTTHFPQSGSMTITFDEAIYSSGIIVNNTNVSSLVSLVSQSDGTSVPCSININGLASVITVIPDGDLSPNASYTLTMAAVEDHVGNTQTGSTTGTFSTDKINIWTGEGSDASQWDDPDNWTTGNGGFSDGTSIYVPASATTFPEINTNLNVYNINIEPGASLTHSAGTLTVNGEFRLQSSATGNASYINTGGSLIVNDDSVKIEQHVAGLAYNYNISSPVAGTTKSNIGIDNSMYYYDNATNTWVEMGDTEAITVGKGYSSKSSQSLVFSGDINTGAMTLSLERSPYGLGWNLVGNPYTASIDWSSGNLVKTNIVDAFWIYLDDQGSYGAYNGASDYSINLTDSKIPSNHAFWVKVNEGQDYDTGSLYLSPDALTANTNTYLKSTSGSKYPGFKLVAMSKSGADETAVALIPDASLAKDKYDTEKMSGSNTELLQIFTLSSENKKLCINGMPQSFTNELPLGYIAEKPGRYTLKIQADYLHAGKELLLIDKKLNTDHNLSQEDYQFDITEKGTNSGRFALKVIQTVPTEIENTNDNYREKFKIYSQNSRIVVETPNLKNLKYYLSDLSGRQIDNGTMYPQATHRIETPQKGIYILTIVSEKGKEEYKVAVE